MLKENQKTWQYEARATDGKLVHGKIIAASAVIARVRLRKQALSHIHIKQLTTLYFFIEFFRKTPQQDKRLQAFASKTRIRHLKQPAVKTKTTAAAAPKHKTKVEVTHRDMNIFLKQFVVVIKSGIPLLRAFDIVIVGMANKHFAAILEDVRFGVGNGLSLAESFGSYPKIFDALFVNFLAIGEQGGILDSLLLRYVEYTEKINVIKRKIKSALTYPAIISIVALIVLAIVLGFVVPQFQRIFAEFGAKLPWPTLIVVSLSDAVIHYWWMFVLLLAGAIMGFRFLYRTVPQFRFIVDVNIFHIPLFGDLVRKSLISRWTRTLSLLFAAGVPLNEALRSISTLTNNYLYGSETLNIQKDIESGSSLCSAMLKTNIFPAMVTQMVSVGEEAGSLDRLLHSVADYYEQEVAILVDILLALLEPVTIIVLGVILGAIIISIYLPLFNLGNVVG